MAGDPYAFIVSVAFDCADPRRLAAFWATVTGYSTELESDDVVRLKSVDPRGIRRLIFWRVPEPKTAKTRVHVDLASRDPRATVEKLVVLGAREIERQPGWTVMEDPEGNEFCVG
ncbi:MAG: VOC family protein [Acidimicrobiales bacterium]